MAPLLSLVTCARLIASSIPPLARGESGRFRSKSTVFRWNCEDVAPISISARAGLKQILVDDVTNVHGGARSGDTPEPRDLPARAGR